MYISKISIQKFRNYRNFAMDLKSFVTIIGENNIGKGNRCRILAVARAGIWNIMLKQGLMLQLLMGEQNCVKLLKDTQEFRYSRCCFKNWVIRIDMMEYGHVYIIQKIWVLFPWIMHCTVRWQRKIGREWKNNWQKIWKLLCRNGWYIMKVTYKFWNIVKIYLWIYIRWNVIINYLKKY